MARQLPWEGLERHEQIETRWKIAVIAGLFELHEDAADDHRKMPLAHVQRFAEKGK